MAMTEYQTACSKAQMVLDIIHAKHLDREKPIVNIADAFAGVIISTLGTEDADLDTEAIFSVFDTHPQYTDIVKGQIELALANMQLTNSIETDWGYFANLLDAFRTMIDSLQPVPTAH